MNARPPLLPEAPDGADLNGMTVAADPARLVPPPTGARHRAPEEGLRAPRHRAADDGGAVRVAALEELLRPGRHAAPDDLG